MDDTFEFDIENFNDPAVEDKVFAFIPEVGIVELVVPDDKEELSNAEND